MARRLLGGFGSPRASIRQLKQHSVATRLGLTTRQVRRLVRQYEQQGPLGLISKLRNRPSNRRLKSDVAEHAFGILRSTYGDFGPTLAAEKLRESHGIDLAVETVRSLMVAGGLWLPRRLRAPKIQQPRSRRAVCATFVAPAIAQHEHEHPAGDPAKLGKVSFPVSCDPAVQPQFSSAVAMLHSFWYEKASETFAAVAQKDPACGMAYWGIAMTYYHPIWEAPGPAELKAGAGAVEKAQSVGAKSQRERDYIAAIGTFYKDSDKLDHRTRAMAYEKAMEQLHARYPDDREAAVFYALALLATAPPTDKTYVNQRKAGAILEPIFVEQPEHPGVAHYIIHAYDYPPLADRALQAARRYAKIAPDSPHALHMPSHIFTRLGLWDESIDSNLASVASAERNNAPGNELHAKDYLIYAYLQEGRDSEAKNALQAVLHGRSDDPQYMNWLYATGTSPARYAVERHRWSEAAALPVPSNTFPRERYAWTEANLHFARALGASHIGDTEAARKDVQQLAAIRDILIQENNKYWADQVDIQREIAAAWITLAEGKREDALQQMRSAADHEDKTDKHNVTPGVILPARELLGEMLLELKQPAEAMVEFEATLSGPSRTSGVDLPGVCRTPVET